VVDWDALVAEHGPMVVGISWRILGHAPDVEDNVQDVFLEAYRLHRREKIGHWRGLLRHLATIGALGRLRRRRKDVALEDVSPLAPGHSPEEHAVGRELEMRLRRQVAALPEREGAVFTLRHFEGLSLAEIAESLGVTYQAAATALSRARAKLERVFGDLLAEKKR
jgi:RNA polymerase sigma-70 factor (ECF subfamily)